MTRQDAIKLLKEDKALYETDCCHAGDGSPDGDLLEALDMAIEALEQEQKWTPVSEEPPTLNDDGVSDMVLLCWSDGQRTVGAYRGDSTFVGQAWPVAKDARVTVTAWMPLPEPYFCENCGAKMKGQRNDSN